MNWSRWRRIRSRTYNRYANQGHVDCDLEAVDCYAAKVGGVGREELDWRVLIDVHRMHTDNEPRKRDYARAKSRLLRYRFTEEHGRDHCPAYVHVYGTGETGGLCLLPSGQMICNYWGNPEVDVSDLMELLHKTEDLAERIREFWPDDKDEKARANHSVRVFQVATQVMGALHRASSEGKQSKKLIESSLKSATNSYKLAEKSFLSAMERSAKVRYSKGMLEGCIWLFLLCVAGAAVFSHYDVPAELGIAIPAGAIGAVVSVLQRMTSGKLGLDPEASRDLMVHLGGLRPVIGAVFALALVGVFESGLVEISTGASTFATYGVIGFLAGFNERFAQDMLGGATAKLSPASTGGEENG